MMKKLSIGEIVSRAWDLAVKHWPIFVLFSFVTSLIGGLGVNLDPATYAQIFSTSDSTAQAELLSEALQVNYPLAIFGALLSIYLGFVVINLYVNTHNTGRPYASLSGVFKVDLNQLAIYFCVSLVYGLIVGLGVVLCILPGIFFAVRLWYAPLLAATQGASFGEAFSRSWEMTKGHFWKLFLLGLTMVGIVILGICACFVGVFFAEVVVEFMLVVSFFMLKPEEPAPAADFSTETSDYLEVK
ncbi:MAG: glycerophosphoryl diester phosphodiesterase membrane domain-containing protein [Bacteroidaceae bacterium]|nr:glycerophosphoryl diester phosphodiesterase membrane domain-containing protein [Bacteroidaceae bacterium]